jgi:hypothetical protein
MILINSTLRVFCRLKWNFFWYKLLLLMGFKLWKFSSYFLNLTQKYHFNRFRKLFCSFFKKKKPTWIFKLAFSNFKRNYDDSENFCWMFQYSNTIFIFIIQSLETVSTFTLWCYLHLYNASFNSVSYCIKFSFVIDNFYTIIYIEFLLSAELIF